MSNHALEQLKRETKDDERLYGCIRELYEQGVPFAELKALIPDIRRTREQLYLKRMLENNNEVLLSMFSKEMSFLLDAKERRQEEEFKKLDQLIRQQQSYRKAAAESGPISRLKKLILSASICKLYIFSKPGQMNGPHRTVSLFCNDNFCLLLIFRIFIIIFIPVNEHNHVRILLDGSGLPKVRKHWPLVRTALHRAGQLRQCDHRYVQLPCQPF